MKVRIVAQMKNKAERRVLVLNDDEATLGDVILSYIQDEGCVFVRVERLVGGAGVFVPDIGGGDIGPPSFAESFTDAFAREFADA